MKFTIYEDMWLRGGNSKQSCLLDSHGKMCCMGFLAKACNIRDIFLFGKGYFGALSHQDADQSLPESVKPQILPSQERLHKGVVAETNLAERIYIVNDDTHIKDTERKERLTKLFAEGGIEVEFVPTSPI
jgi:hypothetical protein